MTTPFLMQSPTFLIRLEIDRLLSAFYSGVHRSKLSGQGFEFKGIRLYDPSDRPSDIDWVASMKLSEDLDMLVSRIRYTEKEISVIVAIYMGETMRTPPKKMEQASILLWLLAVSTFKYRDRFRLILYSDKYIYDSEWLRNEGALSECIAHAETGPRGSTRRVLDSGGLFRHLANLELKDTFVAMISDFADEGEGGRQEIARLGMPERNIKMVFFALDEWSEFIPTGFGMDLQDPQTGDIRRFSNEELLAAQESARLRFEKIASGIKPLAIPFISIPLLADPLKIVRQELFRHEFE